MRKNTLVAIACAGLALTTGLTMTGLDGAERKAARRSSLPRHIIHEGGKYVSQKDGMELVLVPAGESVMGCDKGHYSERPAHPVRLGPFLIDKHEVTNAQFAKFVKETTYKPEGPWRQGYRAFDESDFPVRFVTWHDADAYARWAGRRLPTEAQWERAARGTDGRIYPWGMDWKDGLSRTDQDQEAGPTKVGSFPKGASPYGCLDMGGNVWEWSNDWYDRFYYENFKDNKVAVNPTGPDDGALPEKRFIFTNTAPGNERSTRKVIRGGGWMHEGKENARCSKRTAGNPKYWFPDTGFRCAIWLGPLAI